MTAAEIVAEFARRDITLNARNGLIIARPLSAVPPELSEAVREHKAELLAYLCKSKPASPAYSIIANWQRYGLALRIDPATGDLVVGKAGARADEPTQPWQSLLTDLEAHVEAVARLVEAGWTLKSGFPMEPVS